MNIKKFIENAATVPENDGPVIERRWVMHAQAGDLALAEEAFESAQEERAEINRERVAPMQDAKVSYYDLFMEWDAMLPCELKPGERIRDLRAHWGESGRASADFPADATIYPWLREGVRLRACGKKLPPSKD